MHSLNNLAAYLLTITALFVAGLPASGQISLVKDIIPGTGGGSPNYLYNASGTLYFSANDGINGSEFWKSDGTSAGTVLVKDINAGISGAGPTSFTSVGSTLFFSAVDAANGSELWKSDGTMGGTVLVKDIFAGTSNSNVSNLMNLAGTLFFTATDGINGVELWKSDGTAAGTVLVKDINLGSNSSSPSKLTVLGNTLFFTASDGISGIELWKSDGTTAGTVLVKDINISGNSSPAYMVNLNGTLLFAANDGLVGNELWSSDGTVAGTAMVKDIRPGSVGSLPQNITVMNGHVYFSADDTIIHERELWKSNGTASGTVLVKDISGISGNGSLPQYLTNVDGTLFFTAHDGINGNELWKSDGTATGTVMVKNINNSPSSSDCRSLTAGGNGLLYFVGRGVQTGFELWSSNGTASGTVMVQDLTPFAPGNTVNSNLSNLTVVGNTLFFSANTSATGQELYALSASPLAVSLLSFTGRAEDGLGNRLEWLTAINSNRAGTRYTVTRSATGDAFQPLQTIFCVDGQSEYSTYDDAPLDGANFYRLTIAEASGAISYSPVVTVHNKERWAAGVSLLPQPAHDLLVVALTDRRMDGKAASVIDMQGREVARFILGAHMSLDVRGWTPGLYVLRLPSGEVSRITVQ